MRDPGRAVLLSFLLCASAPAADDPHATAADPQAATAAGAARHWAFEPVRRPAVPRSADTWVRNPIDAFVLRELRAVGLEPAPEADRVTLIRRLRFDLTGLPPTPEEVDAFVADRAPDAYERLVDRLLDTHAYGERWAIPWLDLARYAESDGFKSDKTRPNAWRYRDWVVRALNADLPYDRFVQLQLAGDEVSPRDPEAFIATGFIRNWPYEDNNKVPGLNRQLMLDDMTDTTASVFLGVTLACARCHDHKYDPFSQRDYYRFQALFAAAEPDDERPLADPFRAALASFITKAHDERVAELKHERDAVERPYLVTLLKDKLAKLPVDVRKAFETDPEKRSAFQEDLLVKNAKLMSVPADVIRTAMPEAERRSWEDIGRRMTALSAEAPAPLPRGAGMTDSGPTAPPVRLLFKGNLNQPRDEVGPGFPSVLASSDTPITKESHPAATTGRRAALAAWMTDASNPLTARVAVNRLWQGHFLRGLVATPSDFGTQGTPPSHPELLDWLASELVARGWSLKAIHRLMVTSATYRQASVGNPRRVTDDPDNVFLARMPRRRLEGEAVRDALLAVSGRLDPRVGGRSVFPDLPPGVQTRGGWDRSPSPEDRNRRSVYVFVRRNLRYPLFEAFDAPDTNVTCPERNVSVNAPQALMLLNSELVLDYARSLAARLRREAGADAEARAERAYRLALGRAPTTSERARSIAFLGEGGEEALVDFCHALFNLNEFVFVD